MRLRHRTPTTGQGGKKHDLYPLTFVTLRALIAGVLPDLVKSGTTNFTCLQCISWTNSHQCVVLEEKQTNKQKTTNMLLVLLFSRKSTITIQFEMKPKIFSEKSTKQGKNADCIFTANVYTRFKLIQIIMNAK